MHYRLAVPEDAPALLQIYSEYIHSTITFEYTLPTTEEFAERIRTIAGFYPYIVAEEDGRCMGYAYAHRHMERAAYQWNAELSVYLAKSAVGGLRFGRRALQPPDDASQGSGGLVCFRLRNVSQSA